MCPAEGVDGCTGAGCGTDGLDCHIHLVLVPAMVAVRVSVRVRRG